MGEAMDRLYIDKSARKMPLDSISDIPCRESSGPITLPNNTNQVGPVLQHRHEYVLQ